ncbi:MAG: precorrin-6A reductase [Clostridiales bacterium]|nr:precorrin-6A reductase [Clostridiales bacterium]
MSEVLLYGGTTEARVLAQRLSAAGVSVELHVATAYGDYVMPDLPGVSVVTGRLTLKEMQSLLQKGFRAVVDATHPFAREVSENIAKSLIGSEIPLFRLKRDSGEAFGGDACRYEDHDSCAEALSHTTGNVLLTTGSKNLEAYCRQGGLRDRLYVRILPGTENVEKCEALGIRGRQIIAMQGPFTKEMNLALIHQFSIGHLVTKASGAGSGFTEKAEAATVAGIPLHIIGAPAEAQGMSFAQVAEALTELLGKPVEGSTHVEVSLIGIGMGPEQLTLEAKRALEEAALVFGAPRMLEKLAEGKESYAYYLAEDILPVLLEKSKYFSGGMLHAAVLFSGDTGFYSGCEKIKSELDKYETFDVRVCPGISSVSCLAARAGVSWQEAALVSIHGRGNSAEWSANLLAAVEHHKKTFLLVSDGQQVQEVGQLLTKAGLGDCEILCGLQLSYPKEQLIRLRASEADQFSETGLCTCLIQNPGALPKRTVPGLPDEAFLRDRVPMTKEEVREVSLCKLGLTEDAVIYDVGSGTGSIAVECALRSSGSRIYAIERKPEALALLRRNLEKFHLYQVTPVEGTAPEALEELEPPTHVFVGGSGGHLEEILRCVWEKNPDACVVVNAVSLETIAETTRFLQVFSPLEERTLTVEAVQLQVSRSKSLGAYHLMQAENPVMIFRLMCQVFPET